MLIFLDLDTTGLEADDRICSIAIIDDEKAVLDELVNEGKKIPPLASSVHNITNEMIRDKHPFKESKAYKYLQENNHKQNALIVHNAKFHLEMLANAGVVWQGEVVDTLRVSKHLLQEYCELFSLKVLRYELKLYQNEKSELEVLKVEQNQECRTTFTKALDVKLLYNYLLDFASLEEMQELSQKNVLLQKLEFGKYQGRYIEEIALSDRGYLEWMLMNVSDLDEDLKYSIHYYL